MAFGMSIQMGYDSDSNMAAGEVVKSGIAIYSLEDMETVFEGIPLDEVSTSIDDQLAHERVAGDVSRRRRQAECRL